MKRVEPVYQPYDRKLSRVIDTVGTYAAALIFVLTEWAATRTDRKETR